MIYSVSNKHFDSLDDARAYAISMMDRSNTLRLVEISLVGAHKLITKGYVSCKRGFIINYYNWESNGIWSLKMNGKIDKRLDKRIK